MTTQQLFKQLNTLSKKEKAGQSHAVDFNSSMQSFDFSAVDWNIDDASKQKSVAHSTERTLQGRRQLKKGHNHADKNTNFQYDNHGDDLVDKGDEDKVSGDWHVDMEEAARKSPYARRTVKEMFDDPFSSQPVFPAADLSDDKFLQHATGSSNHDNIEPVDDVFSLMPESLDGEHLAVTGDAKCTKGPPQRSRSTQKSNLRRPTLILGDELEEPPTHQARKQARQLINSKRHPPRHKSLGSALLAHERPTSSEPDHPRQRSVGHLQAAASLDSEHPVSAKTVHGNKSVKDDGSNERDGGDRTRLVSGGTEGNELFVKLKGRLPRVRNPRLARKRQQSSKDPSFDPPLGTSPAKLGTHGVDDQHEKVELNKSNRGTHLFQRNRHKVSGDDNGSPGLGLESLTKQATVIGSLFKSAFMSDDARTRAAGEDDDSTVLKSPVVKAKRLDPRQFFKRNKHAFMDSDQRSASGASSSGDEDESERFSSCEESGEFDEPATAEDRVLALIRQKESEKGDDDRSVPSFLDDEDEDASNHAPRISSTEEKVLAIIQAKNQCEADESDNTIPSFLDSDDDEGSCSPWHNVNAEDKVLALIAANKSAGITRDPILRDELLAEDEDNVYYTRKSSAEDRVLAMIRAKQIDKNAIDSDLRRELLSEDEDSVGHEELTTENSSSRAKSQNHSSHGRRSSKPQSAESKALAAVKAKEKAASRETSGHHRHSHRYSGDEKVKQTIQGPVGSTEKQTLELIKAKDAGKNREHSSRNHQRSSHRKRDGGANVTQDQDNSANSPPLGSNAVASGRRRSDRSSRENISKTRHPDKSTRGSRTLNSTDHRPSKGRVRKIRVNAPELQSDAFLTRKESGSGPLLLDGTQTSNSKRSSLPDSRRSSRSNSSENNSSHPERSGRRPCRGSNSVTLQLVSTG
jgi:hypothetical protein